MQSGGGPAVFGWPAAVEASLAGHGRYRSPGTECATLTVASPLHPFGERVGILRLHRASSARLRSERQLTESFQWTLCHDLFAYTCVCTIFAYAGTCQTPCHLPAKTAARASGRPAERLASLGPSARTCLFASALFSIEAFLELKKRPQRPCRSQGCFDCSRPAVTGWPTSALHDRANDSLPKPASAPVSSRTPAERRTFGSGRPDPRVWFAERRRRAARMCCARAYRNGSELWPCPI
jgi:hypothetical protein